MRVFIPLVGQFTNIGDTLHRSVLLDWVKDEGELHLYIGNAPHSFISGLYLPDNVVLYTSIRKWYAVCISSSKHACFIYNPGEITGSLKRFVKELFLLPLLALYRIRNSAVLKVGVDVQNRGLVRDYLFRFTNMLSEYCYYRTNDSLRRFGRGEVIPDLGFYKYKGGGSRKKYITVSMRGDRYVPSEHFVSAVASFALRHELEVAVVCQVRMDNRSVELLARELMSVGCPVRAIRWDNVVSHADQEQVVNSIYSESLIAISDRLHVLIAASNHGASPLCLAPYYSWKIKKHFDVIDYDDIVYCISSMSSDDIYCAMERASYRSAEINDKVHAASRWLGTIRADVGVRTRAFS